MDKETSIWKSTAAGLIGGLAGSWTMNQFQALLSKIQSQNQDSSSSSDEPATTKAAEEISRRALCHELTEDEKAPAGEAMHYAMGAVSGAIYGAGAGASSAASVGFGVPFGAAVWLVADEGMVPALGLSKPPKEYPASTHLSALAAHLVYGLTTEAVRRAIVKWL